MGTQHTQPTLSLHGPFLSFVTTVLFAAAATSIKHKSTLERETYYCITVIIIIITTTTHSRRMTMKGVSFVWVKPQVVATMILLLLLDSQKVLDAATWTVSHRFVRINNNNNNNDSSDWIPRGILQMEIPETSTTTPTAEGTVDIQWTLQTDTTESFMTFPTHKIHDNETTTTTTSLWLYQLKLQSNDDPNSSTTTTLYTSLPACTILAVPTIMRDRFTFMLNAHGQIISFSYQLLYHHNNMDKNDHDSCLRIITQQEEWKFPTTTNNIITQLQHQLSNPGMTLHTVLPQVKPPPGIQFFPTSSSSSSTTDPTNTPPPSPFSDPLQFLQRYWYILLPIFLMNFMGSSEQPQTTTTTTPPTTTTTTPSNNKQRRGKRG